MKIGAFAAKFGIRPSAIRYYESEGLLSRAARVGGRRDYGPEAVEELRLVLGLQRAGLTIAEIRALLPAFRQERSLTATWRTVAEAKLAELRQVERAVRETRRFLLRSLSCNCSKTGVCEVTRGIGAPAR
jgi:MerR family redox-sensitive transcriptional activator SoxR